MKAFKIITAPYKYEIQETQTDKDGITSFVIDPETKEPKRTMKNCYITFELPRAICNAQLGKRAKDSNVMEDFDLMEFGGICQKIEQSGKDGYCIVSEDQIKTLRKRVKVISPFFGFASYEMFRRVTEAQETTLEEVKTSKK